MNQCNKYIYFVEQNIDTHQTNDIYLYNKIVIHVEQIFDWRKICAKWGTLFLAPTIGEFSLIFKFNAAFEDFIR
jgi:hypothetical protein